MMHSSWRSLENHFFVYILDNLLSHLFGKVLTVAFGTAGPFIISIVYVAPWVQMCLFIVAVC